MKIVKIYLKDLEEKKQKEIISKFNFSEKEIKEKQPLFIIREKQNNYDWLEAYQQNINANKILKTFKWRVFKKKIGKLVFKNLLS